MNSVTSPSTHLPMVDAKPTGPAIDYDLILDCVHCGLCTAACPTYTETGNEASSPRGRIYLMRNVIDGRLELDSTVEKHLDECLNCRACETACPSGVQYGKLIEPFRLHLAERDPGRQLRPLSRLQRLMLMRIFPSRFRTRLALFPVRLMQWTGIDWLLRKSGMLRLLPARLREMHGMLPSLRPHYGRLPEVLPAIGPRRARVALFLGCVADALYPETNWNTAEVLQHNGCEVWIPRQQVCCGALHYHAAYEEQARDYAATNLEVFGLTGAAIESCDAIITNAAGCGAMLKDYDHLTASTPLAEAGKAFKSKIRDVTEFLSELGPVPPQHPLPIRATYHDACHLRHAQQIATPPRQLLQMIPELELVPLVESELCCGAAGSYNLTQPEMASRLGQRKVQHILETQPQAVFTGNVGCLMQIQRYLHQVAPELWVAHPVDALHAAYTGKRPAALSIHQRRPVPAD